MCLHRREEEPPELRGHAARSQVSLRPSVTVGEGLRIRSGPVWAGLGRSGVGLDPAGRRPQCLHVCRRASLCSVSRTACHESRQRNRRFYEIPSILQTPTAKTHRFYRPLSAGASATPWLSAKPAKGFRIRACFHQLAPALHLGREHTTKNNKGFGRGRPRLFSTLTSCTVRS